MINYGFFENDNQVYSTEQKYALGTTSKSNYQISKLTPP
jgi:hypothetical protein